jgi:hypothetical protein
VEKIQMKKEYKPLSDREFHYVNEVTISHDEEFYYMQFGQREKPILLTEEDAQAYKEKGVIDVNIIGRFILDEAFLDAVIRVITAQKEKRKEFLAEIKRIEEEERQQTTDDNN